MVKIRYRGGELVEIVTCHLEVPRRVVDEIHGWIMSGVGRRDSILWDTSIYGKSESGVEYEFELVVRSDDRVNDAGLYDVYVELVIWDENGYALWVYDEMGYRVRGRSFVSIASNFEVVAVEDDLTFKLELVRI